MTRNTLGLDWYVPDAGAPSMAYEVAQTVCMLKGRAPKGDAWLAPARHAVALHIISGRLHRIAERLCNEDLACPNCGGRGEVPNINAHFPHGYSQCPTCAGHGSTLGRRIERLRKAAGEIAQHYGLKPYFQTDPRGCSLYLLTDGLDATSYDRGHAVTRFR